MLRVSTLVWVACLWALACSAPAPLPPRAAELNTLGARALAAGDLEAADARLSLALEYSPEFVEALTNLGLVELRRGNFTRAEQLLSRSLRLNPDIAQTHHALGLLEERRGRRDLAAERYRDALAVDPGFTEARANLARLLFEAREYEHALVQYRLLVEADPGSKPGWYGLGSALLSLGRLEEVRALLERRAPEFSQQPEWTLLEGRRLLLAGQPAAAVELFTTLAHDESPYAVTALAWAAVCQLALGQPRAARELANQALAIEPDDPLATYALAVALDELDDGAAAAWLERARLTNPQNPELERRAERRRHRQGVPRRP